MHALAARTLAVVVVAVLAGCEAGQRVPPDAGAAAPLAIVATTPQVADFARIVGGNQVTVTQLAGPEADPHDYVPTAADLRAIAAAAVVIRNGAGLEGWLDAALAQVRFGGVVIDAGAGVTL